MVEADDSQFHFSWHRISDTYISSLILVDDNLGAQSRQVNVSSH